VKRAASLVMMFLIIGAVIMGGCLQKDSVVVVTKTSMESSFSRNNMNTKEKSSKDTNLAGQISASKPNITSIDLNLTSQQELSLGEEIRKFTQSLNESVRKYGYDNLTIILASNISSLPKLPECGEIARMGENLTQYQESVSKLNALLHEYKNLGEGILEEYGIYVPYLKDREIDQFVNTLDPKSMSVTCNLIEDYNALIDAANQVEPENRETYTEFYLRLLIVGLEIIFFKENLAYKLAYTFVGKFFWKTGLFHIIYRYGGSTALKVAMSVAHWETRGRINKYIDEFGDDPHKISSLISNVSNSTWIEEHTESLLDSLKNGTEKVKNVTSGIFDKISDFFGSKDNG